MNHTLDEIKTNLGQCHVYTGDGKGKTTACLGLALRAAGHGLKVFIGQFTKGRPTGEAAAIKRHLSEFITQEHYGREKFMMIDGPPETEDYNWAQAGLKKAEEAIRSGKYDMVILDEINIAVSFGLIMSYQVTGLIDTRPAGVELILSGRYAHPDVIAKADLVTEMKMVKHYFSQGVMARKGIEE